MTVPNIPPFAFFTVITVRSLDAAICLPKAAGRLYHALIVAYGGMCGAAWNDVIGSAPADTPFPAPLIMVVAGLASASSLLYIGR
jgi:hypothetical protein